MRKRLLLALIAVVISCFIVWGIVGTSIKIRELKADLEKLYWIAENTHSSMVGRLIDEWESKMQQQTTILSLLITALVAIPIVANIYPKGKQAVITLLLLLLMLTSIPVSPVSARLDTTETSQSHYYARIEMYVPANPPNGALVELSGKITPMWNEVNNHWVAYHVGVTFKISLEWLSCGYITQIDVGRRAYAEWMINGQYDEMFGENITFYEKYFAKVARGRFSSGAPYWTPQVWDDDGNPMLEEIKFRGLPASGKPITAVAGGETDDTINSMSAEFSYLMWQTKQDESLDSGFWDGDDFPCVELEYEPYVVNVFYPYYQFDVAGGGYGNDDLCTVQIGRGIGGTTTPPAGFYKYPEGKMFQLTASPSPVAYFMCWLADGVRKYKNPTTVVFGLHHLLIPFFYHEWGGGGHIWHLKM